jgi:hypothetical protein
MKLAAYLLAAAIASAHALHPSTARAQGPVGAQPGPDIVKLKSGAMYRGTISELVPDDHVEIVLVSGQTKRFPLADVDYAGPDNRAAPAAPPAQGGVVSGEAPPERAARLAFRAEGDDRITLHQVTGSTYGVVVGYRMFGGWEGHSFKMLCTAPCATRLEPSTYEFALSRGEGRPVITSRVEVPPGPSTLQASYTSRARLRAGGIAVLVMTVGVSLALFLIPFVSPSKECDSSGYCFNHYDLTAAYAGVGVMLVGTVAGVVMVTRRDIAHVELIPGVEGMTAPRLLGMAPTEGAVAAGAASPGGLSLRVRF